MIQQNKFQNLDKSKAYCKKCLDSGVVTPLKNDKDFEEYYASPMCGHMSKGFYRYEFRNNSWSCIKGRCKNTLTQSEINTPHNQSKEMRELSIKLGSTYGKENILKTRAKLDRWISCEECNDRECTVRGISNKNFMNMGARCQTKYNYSKENIEHITKLGLQPATESTKEALKKTHQKMDGWKSCNECNDLECQVRNKFKRNWFNINCCTTKQTNSEKMKEISKNHAFLLNSRQILGCLKCHKDTPHDGFGFCIICNPRVSNSLFNENKTQYFDKNINKYINWNEYKSKFKTQNIDFQLPKGFKLYSTFRNQNSDNWGGAKLAFEQSLVDDNITWFIYIKFYLTNDGQKLPLVVGKSGSLLVNNSGSDVSFSTNVENGPARVFLNEESLNWDKTQIAILKCDNEEKAYELEAKYQQELNLFGS